MYVIILSHVGMPIRGMIFIYTSYALLVPVPDSERSHQAKLKLSNFKLQTAVLPKVLAEHPAGISDGQVCKY